MPFQLTDADRDALSQVSITIDGDGEVVPSITLNEFSLMFPPIVTKDSKTAKWQEWQSGGFEPFKYYEQSQSRQLGLQFEWVTGGFGGDKFKPAQLHLLISKMKSYFYGAYFGGDKQRYPRVLIRQLYEIVPRSVGTLDPNSAGGDSSQGGATFRMMSLDVKYSGEMTRVDEKWYPLHVKVNMSLESTSQIATSGEEISDGPFKDFNNLIKRPHVEWF